VRYLARELPSRRDAVLERIGEDHRMMAQASLREDVQAFRMGRRDRIA
jgi:hypothetical protein